MEWSRGPIIGRGASATVSFATAASSGDQFAVKSTELSRSIFLQKEQKILAQLGSPYIVKYFGHDISFENGKLMYNLFMEYVAGGSLSDEIKKQGGKLDESIIRSYACQLVQGLDYLHSNGLVHCDVKSSNILVGKDGLKIADLGCARLVEETSPSAGSSTSAFSGTPVFMAPEVASGVEQGFPADIWALGCTIIEMATGSNPWPEVTDPVSALYRIGFSGDIPEFPRRLSEKGKDFLSKCLSRDPKDRWTAKELLNHSFLDDDFEEKITQLEVKDSPTCVLDQGFWDSLEESEISLDPINLNSLLNSPAERIRKLMGNSCFSNSNLASWCLDENWVTVRSNDVEQGQNWNVVPGAELSWQTGLGRASSIHEEELEEDFNFCSDEEISVIINNSFGFRRGFLIDHWSVKVDLVIKNVNFEKINENIFVSFKFIFSSI